jgi:prepilin-type N-terminal cleavage/methylation domain-containing protein
VTRRAAEGFTIIEILVVLFLMSIVSLIFYQLLDGTISASMYMESHNDLSTFGQQAVNAIQTEIHQSKMLFQDDSLGNAYRNALQVPATYPVWGGNAGSRMPLFDESTQQLHPDTGTGSDRRVGNCLLIARQLAPLTIDVDTDGDDNNDSQVLADRYRFQFYYLSPNSKRSFRGSGYYLDLVESRSVIYSDYFQLINLSDQPAARPVRQQVGRALYVRGITQSWDPGQSPDTAFHSIDEDGILSEDPITDPLIETTARSLLPQFAGGRISGNMDYSVGFMPASGHRFPVRTKVPVFAQPDETFPGGLEFLVVGPTGSRKVLTRLVLFSAYKAVKMDSQETSVITSSRS